MGRPRLTSAEVEEREIRRRAKRKRPLLTEDEKRERRRARKAKQRKSETFRAEENGRKRTRYQVSFADPEKKNIY